MLKAGDYVASNCIFFHKHLNVHLLLVSIAEKQPGIDPLSQGRRSLNGRTASKSSVIFSFFRFLSSFLSVELVRVLPQSQPQYSRRSSSYDTYSLCLAEAGVRANPCAIPTRRKARSQAMITISRYL